MLAYGDTQEWPVYTPRDPRAQRGQGTSHALALWFSSVYGKGIATRSVRTLLGAPGHTRNKGIATNVASCYVRNYLKHCVPQFAHFRSLVLCDTCDRGKGVNHRPPMKGLNLTLVTTSLHKSSLILVAMHLLLVAYCFYS